MPINIKFFNTRRLFVLQKSLRVCNDIFADGEKNCEFGWFLVRLRSTYRVHFCRRRRRHSRRRRREEINPIGMYDSSNESSQRTE